jgi:microcompartment protein CcmL/EutN
MVKPEEISRQSEALGILTRRTLIGAVAALPITAKAAKAQISDSPGVKLVTPELRDQPQSPRAASLASQAATNATAGERVSSAKVIPVPTPDVIPPPYQIDLAT